MRARVGGITASLVAIVVVAGASPASAHPDLELVQRFIAAEAARRPEDPSAQLNQAQARLLARDFDGALVALEHAAAHGAAAEDVAGLRGAVFLEAGLPRIALVELDRSLASRPLQPGVLVVRARARMQVGDPRGAATDLAAAVDAMREPTPDHVVAWRDALVASGDPAAALAALDHGMTRVGAVPSLQLAALDLALELGREEDALRRIDALLATEPRNHAWHARRGDVLVRLGRTDEAREAYARALERLHARRAGGTRSAELERRLRTALAALHDDDRTTSRGNP